MSLGPISKSLPMPREFRSMCFKPTEFICLEDCDALMLPDLCTVSDRNNPGFKTAKLLAACDIYFECPIDETIRSVYMRSASIVLIVFGRPGWETFGCTTPSQTPISGRLGNQYLAEAMSGKRVRFSLHQNLRS
jgi:hypothetical protein